MFSAFCANAGVVRIKSVAHRAAATTIVASLPAAPKRCEGGCEAQWREGAAAMVTVFWVIFINLTFSFSAWLSVQSGIFVRSCRFVVNPHERLRLHIDALLLDPLYGVQGKF